MAAPSSITKSPIPNRQKRIVVVMPNWLGDGVMATPFLQALRRTNPQAYIAVLALPLIMPVLAGLPGIDEAHAYKRHEEAAALAWLKAGRFDIGYLLPNSFRSAWMLWRAGVKERLGYAREGRGLLLTKHFQAEKRSTAEADMVRQRQQAQRRFAADIRAAGGTLVPPKKLSLKMLLPQRTSFKPVPTIDYYLKLLELPDADLPAARPMTLGITPSEQTEAQQVLSQQGIEANDRLVMLVPGANFGSSKCWSPERFAQVAEHLIAPHGRYRARVILAGAPTEKPIIDAIVAATKPEYQAQLVPLTNLNQGQGVTLGAVKALVAHCTLMICNDTGPRHFACALGANPASGPAEKIGVITLFGPTDPLWAETFYNRERQVTMHPLPACGPCQLKRCPIDHRCMNGLEVAQVLAAVADLWPSEQV